ncbi:unnamed protein product [Haemonchus placei]|uniref:Uncharacterized protein n=1 Tax=Haemonchus placei TaxID=6290 RepID=A0A0N4VYG5_HAEPC|nr:unnamed protein product [Haemonchus placei]
MWTSLHLCKKIVFFKTNIVEKTVHRATSWPAALKIRGFPRYRGYSSLVTGWYPTLLH